MVRLVRVCFYDHHSISSGYLDDIKGLPTVTITALGEVVSEDEVYLRIRCVYDSTTPPEDYTAESRPGRSVNIVKAAIKWAEELNVSSRFPPEA